MQDYLGSQSGSSQNAEEERRLPGKFSYSDTPSREEQAEAKGPNAERLAGFSSPSRAHRNPTPTQAYSWTLAFHGSFAKVTESLCPRNSSMIWCGRRMIGERDCVWCGKPGTRIIQSAESTFATFWLCEDDDPKRDELKKLRKVNSR